MTVAEVAARSTKGFIDENPVELVLTRAARLRTTAGGWEDGELTDLTPQRVRLVAQTNRNRLNPDGDVTVPAFVLVGLPGTDVAEGDIFSYQGNQYRVGRPVNGPAWAVRMEVFRHGR